MDINGPAVLFMTNKNHAMDNQRKHVSSCASTSSSYLSEPFFPNIELSPERIEEFKLLSHELLEQSLETDSLPTHSFHWEQIKAKSFVTSFKGAVRRGSTNCKLYKSVATVKGDVPEFVSTRLSHSNEEFQCQSQALNDSFKEGKILYSIESPTETDPFRQIVLKWKAFRPSIFPAYDLTYLEYTGMTIDAHGNEIGFCVGTSIDLPELPPFASYKRAQMTGLEYLFRYSEEEGHVDITRAAYMSNNHDSNTLFASVGFERSFEIIQLTKYAQMMQFDTKNFVLEKDWVSKSARSSCNVCDKKFNPFRGKSHCRCCGEVICSSCYVNKRVLGEHRLIIVKICKECLLDRRSKKPEPEINEHESSVERKSYCAENTSKSSTSTSATYEECPDFVLGSLDSLQLEEDSNRTSNTPKCSFNTRLDGLHSSLEEQSRLLMAIAGKRQDFYYHSSPPELQRSERVIELS